MGGLPKILNDNDVYRRNLAMCKMAVLLEIRKNNGRRSHMNQDGNESRTATSIAT